MAASDTARTGTSGHSKALRRDVGLLGLTFFSLGSIIGSGWLLGALDAAEVAGPASLISWILAAFMLAALALVTAELGSAYPVAGGMARFPYFAFGPVAGFTAGWAAYLQAVTIAPIEVEAALTYLQSTDWAQRNLVMLNANGTLTGVGFVIATAAMLLFTLINLWGVKLLADSNNVVVIWKIAVPILTIIVLMTLTFHTSNFTAGGGFAPFGAHGIFAALPVGVVFALQGFEQAVQMGGEARDPRRHLSRAIISAMFIGAAIYILLEITFVTSLHPSHLANGWSKPLGAGADKFGAYYILALGAGAGWLATILLIDAVISPAGTGLIYLGTSARLSYALGEEPAMPDKLTDTSKRGIPVWSVLLALVLGLLTFLPFPSWASLVGLVTEATAVMYGFAPVSLAALHKRDPHGAKAYRAPIPAVLCPAAFCFANLIIYWSTFDANWKIFIAIGIGVAIFGGALLARGTRAGARGQVDWRSTMWIWPWFGGMTLIGYLGRYGGNNTLPDWWDLAVVIGFSLLIFYWAVSLAMDTDRVRAAVETERQQLEAQEDLNLPG
jgi:amino acid transporter